MQSILTSMLEKYNAKTLVEKKNAIKEVVQEVALCGLARAGFFKHAAFYGGTALRVFYDLDRFSEDLDFSLVAPNDAFDLSKYFPALEKELASVGLDFSVEEKAKSVDTNIKSAFLKGNTRQIILSISPSSNQGIPATDVIKIKFELDTNPPAFANFENKYRLLPSPYMVKLYDLPSLFAGKIHAVLCRAWQNRVKGRDLYDYIFYLAKGVSVNLDHFKARLVDTGTIDADFVLTLDAVKEMLIQKFATINYEQAKQDVLPFVKDASKLDLWGENFFVEITKQGLI